MGRHSSGQNNYRLSGSAIAALVVALALVAGLIWFVVWQRGASESTAAQGDGSGTNDSCVSGDITLPVASSNAVVGKELVDAYAASNPVVRDYCIRPQLVETLSDAAVYIAPNTPIAHQELARSDRTAAVADPEQVFADVVGLSGQDNPGPNVPLQKVVFPTQMPASSAVVASLLADSDSTAVNVLTDQQIDSVDGITLTPGMWVATSKANSLPHAGFYPLDASVIYTAIPLNSGATVDENQARAGQDFARFSAQNFDAETPKQPVIAEMVWAAAMPTGGAALTADGNSPTNANDAAVAADGQVGNTVFLLDTSGAMEPYLESAKRGVERAADEVTAAGHNVALWNYSSPLSVGVTNGYRDNVAMTSSPSAVKNAVAPLTTGGVPQTREAVTAAVGSFPSPVRIVVITTGTADGEDDAVFTKAIQAGADSGTSIAVVHVGSAPHDKALEAVAASRQQVGSAAELEAAIVAATGTRS